MDDGRRWEGDRVVRTLTVDAGLTSRLGAGDDEATELGL